MARRLFEEQGLRIRRGSLARPGTVFIVYTDSAGTVPADISATSGGSAIAGSAVATADIDGLGPAAFRFYGPDGVDTLYLRCPSDASLGVQEIEADTDERLDALEAGGVGGGAHPDLATHDALGLATDAEVTAHVAAADPHGGYVLESAHTLATHDALGLATDTELSASVTSAVSAHAAAADPHAGYELESDHTLAAHNSLGLATDAELATHAAASDPHGDRAYADSVSQGLDPKASVLVKTTGNLTLSGEQTIDGVLTSASRVLVANQTAAEENGVYVSAAGAWSRATDADASGEVTTGLYTFVEEGTTQASSGWVLTTPAPITLGTTPLVFSQFSQAGQVFGGAGLLKTGNTLDVIAGTGIAVAGDTVGISPGGVSATELAASAVTNAKVDPAAAIAESKLTLAFPTHAEDHAARHAAAGADPLAGYATAADQAAHESAVDPHQGYVLESAHTLATHDTLGLVTDAILATHDADTTVVHGIADTSKVALELAVTDRGLFVSTTGSDSNDGLSAGAAKLTVQAALDAVAVAGGGEVTVLGGTHNQTAELVADAAANRPIRIRGMGSALTGGATTLRWATDLGSGKFGIRANTTGLPYNYFTIEGMRLLGPLNAIPYGSFPADMDGVQLSRRVIVRDCHITGFRAGVKVTADHNRLEQVATPSNGYGVYFQDMTSYGDHVLNNCDLSSVAKSSIAIGPTGSLLGATMIRGHTGYAPYCIFIEDGRNPASIALGGSLFMTVSFEALSHGAIVNPDMLARTQDVTLFECGTFSHYNDQDIAGEPNRAMIQVGTMERWQFIHAFPGHIGTGTPAMLALIKANQIEDTAIWQSGFIDNIDLAIAAGITSPIQGSTVLENTFVDRHFRGVIAKAAVGSGGVTAGQLVGRTASAGRDHVVPYATAYGTSPDNPVFGVAHTGGPAQSGTTPQDCVIVVREGNGELVLTSAATPAAGTPLMVDPASASKVTASDGRLDLPLLGFASGSQSGSVSGTSCKIDLIISRASGVRRKTVTGSRGGNAAVASLLTQLSAQGLITDSSSA